MTTNGPTLRLGISTCLLGERVRYDGGHKLDRYLVNELGTYVEWIPVCPEVECGMPIPRPPIRLVGDPESPRLVEPKSGTDYTEQMQAWAEKKARLFGNIEFKWLCVQKGFAKFRRVSGQGI